MSLDQAAVVRHYKQLCITMDLPLDKVVLSAGAAMVMLGLRKHTNDLDVDVPKEFFEKHKERKGAKLGLTGELVMWDGMVDIHPLPDNFTREDLMDHMGVWIYHPTALIKQKEKMIAHPDRKPEKIPQDRKDIIALKELIDNVIYMRSRFEKADLNLQKEKVK